MDQPQRILATRLIEAAIIAAITAGITMYAQQKVIEHTIGSIESSLTNHHTRPWHEETGRLLARNEAALQQMDRLLADLERRVRAIENGSRASR